MPKPEDLLDVSPDALIAVAADGRVHAWLGAAERLFGWTADEAVGRPVAQLLHGDVEGWRARADAVFLTRCRCRDGRAIAVEGRARRARDLVVVALRPAGAEPPFAELPLLEAAPDALVIVGADGRIERVNEQALRMFGHTREELTGQPVETLVPHRFRARHPEFRERYAENPHPRPMGEGIELQALRRDGSEFTAEISLAPLDTGAGLRVIAAVRDVTERRRIKREYLANVSHELRTPLNSVIGFARLMVGGLGGPITDTQREYLEDILTSADHLLQLINDVLDAAKVEAGRMEFHRQVVDLQALLEEVCESMRAVAAAKRVILRADVSLETVTADPGRLKQVLLNFVSNAVKFSHDGGVVDVRARAEAGGRFRVEVEDRGIGIAAADLPRLFVQFQQLDSGPAKRHGGTGLGLSFTRRLVEAQGGTVGVTSEPGRGSTFFAVLPGGPP